MVKALIRYASSSFQSRPATPALRHVMSELGFCRVKPPRKDSKARSAMSFCGFASSREFRTCMTIINATSSRDRHLSFHNYYSSYDTQSLQLTDYKLQYNFRQSLPHCVPILSNHIHIYNHHHVLRRYLPRSHRRPLPSRRR